MQYCNKQGDHKNRCSTDIVCSLVSPGVTMADPLMRSRLIAVETTATELKY